MHRLAKDGGTIIGQKPILGKDGSGVGGIRQDDGEGGSGGNVVDCRDVEVPFLIDGDFAVGFCAVVDLV